MSDNPVVNNMFSLNACVVHFDHALFRVVMVSHHQIDMVSLVDMVSSNHHSRAMASHQVTNHQEVDMELLHMAMVPPANSLVCIYQYRCKTQRLYSTVILCSCYSMCWGIYVLFDKYCDNCYSSHSIMWICLGFVLDIGDLSRKWYLRQISNKSI